MFSRRILETLLHRARAVGRIRGDTIARLVIAAAAVGVFAAGLRWGTNTAGSSDSYGYVSQASLWMRADLVVDQPIARDAPWSNADSTFSPLGYRPGLETGTIVPVYPAGLPIVMAILQAVAGAGAVYLAVPLLAAVAVVSTAWLAWRMASPAAGAAAAWLFASRSIVTYSVMWPMSDVPAAGWWALAIALATGAGVASAAGSGAAAAMAILTRPNLAPLALAPALYLAGRIWLERTDRRAARRRLSAFIVLAALGALAVAAIHTRLYGSPLRSGYGEVTRVYAATHASSMASNLLAHPLKFDLALLVLAVAGVVVVLRHRPNPGARAIAGLLIAAVGLVLAAHAFYRPSPDWWYLRFLLAAYAPLAALGGVTAVWLSGLAPPRWRMLALVLLVAALVTRGVWRADEWRAFEQRGIESRYKAVARFARQALPERAVFLAFQQSGSLRHYAERLTLRFDRLAPASLEPAIAFLTARGYQPYFVIEDPETTPFRNRFRRASPLGQLDWPPVAELRGPVRVQIFDPADRARWFAGERLFPRRIEP